jgi:hypothetical protein
MMEAMRPSETPVLTRATRCIPQKTAFFIYRKCWYENCKGSDHLEDLDIDEIIILKM